MRFCGLRGSDSLSRLLLSNRWRNKCLVVNCLHRRLREGRDLPSEFQQFAVQCIILLRCLPCDFFDANAEPVLPHKHKNRDDGRG